MVPKSSITETKSISRPKTASTDVAALAHQRKMYKSNAMACSQLGRCTFRATSSKSPTSFARYTCPMLAAATGSSSTSWYTSSNLMPKLASTMASATSVSKGGTRSCSFCSSTRYSAGKRSGRDASACPALMIAGLISQSASVSSLARCRRRSSSSLFTTSAATLATNPASGKKDLRVAPQPSRRLTPQQRLRRRRIVRQLRLRHHEVLAPLNFRRRSRRRTTSAKTPSKGLFRQSQRWARRRLLHQKKTPRHRHHGQRDHRRPAPPPRHRQSGLRQTTQRTTTPRSSSRWSRG
mmetsp:Transcript_19573/g.62892  ORF Transcript_19573/g.62892 Transcript_19573/m.62892 type:complete len:294 (+) Transcript_19573:967-1848(+)